MTNIDVIPLKRRRSTSDCKSPMHTILLISRVWWLPQCLKNRQLVVDQLTSRLAATTAITVGRNLGLCTDWEPGTIFQGTSLPDSQINAIEAMSSATWLTPAHISKCCTKYKKTDVTPAILSHDKIASVTFRVTRVFNSHTTLFPNSALLYSVQLCWQNAERWLVSCHRCFCFASVCCTYSSLLLNLF